MSDIGDYTTIVTNTSELINPLMPTQDEVKDSFCKYLHEDVNELTRTVTITNKLELSLNVTKVWDDEGDQDGMRPDNVTIILKADDAEIERVTLNSSNWTYTFKNLKICDEDGHPIEYSVDELNVPENYTKAITKEGYAFYITNTHNPENISLNISKIWNDSDNQDGVRPNNITINLLADNELIKTVQIKPAKKQKRQTNNV